MAKRKNALWALGLAGIAYYLFNMKPDQKQKIKDTVKDFSDKAMDKIPTDLKEKLGLNKEDFAK